MIRSIPAHGITTRSHGDLVSPMDTDAGPAGIIIPIPIIRTIHILMVILTMVLTGTGITMGITTVTTTTVFIIIITATPRMEEGRITMITEEFQTGPLRLAIVQLHREEQAMCRVIIPEPKELPITDHLQTRVG